MLLLCNTLGTNLPGVLLGRALQMSQECLSRMGTVETLVICQLTFLLPSLCHLLVTQSCITALPHTKADALPIKWHQKKNPQKTKKTGKQVLCNQNGNFQRPRVKDSLISLHFWLYCIVCTSQFPLKPSMANKEILSKLAFEFNYWGLLLFPLVIL